ncbi:hypothetical protein J6590_041108 [Homalodisca vitripennis]|nr:hypothetical protein J6590_041108 [Homalodisca vitripennis]
MSSASKTTLPQVGTGHPGNGSDRLDGFLGCQEHENMNEDNNVVVHLATKDTASTPSKGMWTKIGRMQEAIEHLIQVLDDRNKRTVNGGTRALAYKVRNEFASIKSQLKEINTNKKSSPLKQGAQQLNYTPGRTSWQSPLQSMPVKRKERTTPERAIKKVTLREIATQPDAQTLQSTTQSTSNAQHQEKEPIQQEPVKEMGWSPFNRNLYKKWVGARLRGERKRGRFNQMMKEERRPPNSTRKGRYQKHFLLVPREAQLTLRS